MALTQGLTKFTTASPIIASYNYYDIAEGTGVKIFYGYSHKEDTTMGYSLSSTTLYSESINTTTSTTDTVFVKILDLDFDLSAFNIPRKIKGTATVTGTIGATATGTASTSGEVYLIVKLRKWDGTSETEIANAQSSTLVFPATDATWKTINFQITVPETNFATGETLRATAEIWAKRTSTNDRANVGLYHDPKATTTAPTGSKTTILQINFPFKLEV